MTSVVTTVSPVLVEAVRNGFVESRHRGSAVVLDGDGQPDRSWGDPASPVLVRSSSKPLLAVGMVRLGLELPADQLVMVCASHSGEPSHLEQVERLLADHGLSVDDLQNTPDHPADPVERDRWIRDGLPVSRLVSNCSGKHAGMLATCRARGWPLEGYLHPDHPLQRSLIETIEELAGERVAHVAVDGCGAPAVAVSLTGLARAFGLVARAGRGSPEGRVADAIRAWPELLGGSRRDVTDLLRRVPGLIAKDGAEAVYVAALPDGRAAALKVDDGGQRARPVVMAALLRGLGVPADQVESTSSSVVLGGGESVGTVHATPALTQR